MAAALSEHRKIDLQSHADLAHIHNHLARTARDKIDRALPPAAAPQGEDDKLRRRVEELVEQYVRDLWGGVRQNVRVNGMDVVGEGVDGAEAAGAVEDDLEPFDLRLADRIRALETQKEVLTERVADLRRTAPRLAADNFEAQFLREAEDWERSAAAQHDAEMARAEGEEGGGEAGLRVEADSLQRWDEVRKTWERGAEALVELKAGMGETRARVERAKRAVEYVEGR